MIFEHLRQRRRVGLLAAGALEPSEEPAVRAHLRRCERCRAEFDELHALVEAAAADPLRSAEPELPLPVLVELVERRVEQALASPRAQQAWRWGLGLPAAALAALLVALLVPRLVPRLVERRHPTPDTLAVGAESVARLERALAREQTARYLGEARAVLVGVAATPPACQRGRQQWDVAAEARRSRDLLERRTALTDLAGEHAPSAGRVLNDVEGLLREVAALEDCSRSEELLAIQARLSERRLLMKLELVERELAG